MKAADGRPAGLSDTRREQCRSSCLRRDLVQPFDHLAALLNLILFRPATAKSHVSIVGSPEAPEFRGLMQVIISY